LVVVLCTFERSFGRIRMPKLFGPQAPAEFIDALNEKIRDHDLAGLKHPENVKEKAELIIREMQREKKLPK
jgi:hypothetical protein